MNFKNIVWFIKAISYFVLLRSLGMIIIIIINISSYYYFHGALGSI